MHTMSQGMDQHWRRLHARFFREIKADTDLATIPVVIATAVTGLRDDTHVHKRFISGLESYLHPRASSRIPVTGIRDDTHAYKRFVDFMQNPHSPDAESALIEPVTVSNLLSAYNLATGMIGALG